jgi:hypothetical protein
MDGTVSRRKLVLVLCCQLLIIRGILNHVFFKFLSERLEHTGNLEGHKRLVSRGLLFIHLHLFLIYFPYFEKYNGTYEVTLLAMCLLSPTLPTNSSVKPSRGNEHTSNNKRTVGLHVFYAVGLVSNTQNVYVVSGK